MNEKAKCKNCTDEMIEEMAKEIFNTCAWRFGKPNDYKEICKDIAEDLIKLGYTKNKIPEGSVVLSKEEYEGKEIVVEMSGGHKLRLTVGKFGEMCRVLEEYTRKETAKEIIEMIEKRYGYMGILEDIAKQFGVEVEE